MTKKTKLIVAVSVLLGVLLIAGVSTLAATNYGTQSDPLVSLSYIEQTVVKSINDSINQAIESAKASLSSSFDAKVDEFTQEIESQLPGSGSGGSSTNSTDTFVVVTMTNGQTMTCPVGTEILLRIGSAVTYGPDSPRLVDSTTGSAVSAAGTALTANHMYLVTIQGNGIQATSSTVKVLVRGEYTLQ